ncbi:hypothetical protein NKR23_g10492 [Pleurostoma richardsiae]|uniref:Uncharacterized protein n=1 Tax=Pleurostoma richardsiae TaxID=41990 RepID=A0AA38VE74_9PEZI|nr:hypothetical protein NKR23_g10492 [Pleurostoma richardsiae]
MLLLAACVSASVIQMRDADPLDPWVTIDKSGSAKTIMPSATTINGHTTTVSGAPDYVTRTSVYTLTTAVSQVVTSTGMAPFATATATSGAGAFPQCSNYQGFDAPFCLPRRGSVIAPGRSYYVTWDPSWFADGSTQLQVQGEYPSGVGFTTGNISASTGYYVWSIDSDLLTEQGASELTVQLSLIDMQYSGQSVAEGPAVTVSDAAADVSPHGGSSGKTVAIAVPVVIGVVALLAAGFCLWSWRRHGRILGFGGGSSSGGGKSGQGYGVRQSRSQRVGGAAVPVDTDKSRGIQLTDRESWSPTQGRNVFREEIERQEHGGA